MATSRKYYTNIAIKFAIKLPYALCVLGVLSSHIAWKYVNVGEISG